MRRRILCIALCFVLIALSIPVGATEQSLTVATAQDLLTLVENCRLDSYSLGLTVSLEADIDLSGREFEPIPIFSGSFLGNGHTVSGLKITGDGSDVGLFRYLTETAVVSDLYVRGEVTPGGSRGNVGGIAGVNKGQLLGCTFQGTVSGADRVGGLVGSNAVTGVIDEGCVSGSVYGNHFVGGIAGENSGVIRNLVNEAGINETVRQNTIDISDITVDTITNSEAVNTVTDIGGIAGSSCGVIRGCRNNGAVGYPQMGYNIGGIAGSQSGYIADCENHGTVSGRKEVGGIAGQMIPVTFMDYSVDTLQILEGQLAEVSVLADRAAANTQSNATELRGQITQLQAQADTARDAVETLIPDKDNPQPPDSDTIAAAQNNLSASLGAMPGTITGITSTAEGTAKDLTRDLQALSNGIAAMGNTLDNASSNLGGSISDASDADTEEDLTAKVHNCANHGAIVADLNGGGIAGAMSFENDLDPDANLQFSGQLSLNFDTTVRCVITACRNLGAVTVKKAAGGGIVGWQSMGLVKQCFNAGALAAQNAEQVGGIAGSSGGYIRACQVRCTIAGNTAVGGIAGIGAVVSDCYSLSVLHGSEQVGALLGQRQDSYAQEEMPVRSNFYFAAEKDPGAIDGISYEGIAQALTLEAFLAPQGMTETFGTATVTFVLEDGTTQVLSLPTGSALDAAAFPVLPEKAGFSADWDGPENTGHVYFDMTFRAVYTPLQTVVQSEEMSGELPVLLAQGQFPTADSFRAMARSESGAIAAYELEFADGSTANKLRWLIPAGYEAKQLQVQVRSADGTWRTVAAAEDGSYLAFAVTAGDSAVALFPAPRDLTFLWVLIAAGVLLAAGVTVTVCLVRKKRG